MLEQVLAHRQVREQVHRQVQVQAHRQVPEQAQAHRRQVKGMV